MVDFSLKPLFNQQVSKHSSLPNIEQQLNYSPASSVITKSTSLLTSTPNHLGQYFHTYVLPCLILQSSAKLMRLDGKTL